MRTAHSEGERTLAGKRGGKTPHEGLGEGTPQRSRAAGVATLKPLRKRVFVVASIQEHWGQVGGRGI